MKNKKTRTTANKIFSSKTTKKNIADINFLYISFGTRVYIPFYLLSVYRITFIATQKETKFLIKIKLMK